MLRDELKMAQVQIIDVGFTKVKRGRMRLSQTVWPAVEIWLRCEIMRHEDAIKGAVKAMDAGTYAGAPGYIEYHKTAITALTELSSRIGAGAKGCDWSVAYETAVSSYGLADAALQFACENPPPKRTRMKRK